MTPILNHPIIGDGPGNDRPSTTILKEPVTPLLVTILS